MALLLRIRRFQVNLSLLSLAALPACSSIVQPTSQNCVVPVGDSPTRGPADAWVTGVEFGDFECPYCGEAEVTVKQVDAERPGIVRWVWKNLPLTSIHPRAMPDAIAAECAYDQNHFLGNARFIICQPRRAK